MLSYYPESLSGITSPFCPIIDPLIQDDVPNQNDNMSLSYNDTTVQNVLLTDNQHFIYGYQNSIDNIPSSKTTNIDLQEWDKLPLNYIKDPINDFQKQPNVLNTVQTLSKKEISTTLNITTTTEEKSQEIYGKKRSYIVSENDSDSSIVEYSDNNFQIDNNRKRTKHVRNSKYSNINDDFIKNPPINHDACDDNESQTSKQVMIMPSLIGELLTERQIKQEKLARKAALARAARIKKKCALQELEKMVKNLHSIIEKKDQDINERDMIINSLRQRLQQNTPESTNIDNTSHIDDMIINAGNYVKKLQDTLQTISSSIKSSNICSSGL